jgi:hypothetical protein
MKKINHLPAYLLVFAFTVFSFACKKLDENPVSSVPRKILKFSTSNWGSLRGSVIIYGITGKVWMPMGLLLMMTNPTTAT